MTFRFFRDPWFWLALVLGVGLPLLFAWRVDAGTPAPDRRECVSKREWRSMPFVAREVLERRWETRGQVDRTVSPDAGSRVYRACGYGLDEAFVVVWYSRHGVATDSLRSVGFDATIHGHERIAR